MYEDQTCPICNMCPPNGNHFGVLCCGACAAFFRRTVSEEKIFPCTRQTSAKLMGFVKAENLPSLTASCRHCRYLKCVDAGMQVERVLPRRCRTDVNVKRLSIYGESGESIGRLVKGMMFVEHERHIAFGSMDKEYKISTMKGASAAAATELNLIDQFFGATHLLNYIPETEQKIFKRNVYFLWAQVHSIWLTHLKGGFSANRMCYVDRTYMNINEDAISSIYKNVHGLKNVDTIVRLTTPMFFEFRSIVRMIQRYRIDQVEYLVLSQLAYISLVKTLVQLPRKRQKQLYEYHKQLLVDLDKYHKQHYKGEEAVRFGNMTLLIESIQQAARAVQEQVTLLYLSGYKTAVDRSKK